MKGAWKCIGPEVVILRKEASRADESNLEGGDIHWRFSQERRKQTIVVECPTETKNRS